MFGSFHSMRGTSLNSSRIDNLFSVVSVRIVRSYFLWRNAGIRSNVTVVRTTIIIMIWLLRLMLQRNVHTLVLTQFWSIAFISHVSKSLSCRLIELIFRTAIVEETLTGSHVRRSVVVKYNTVVIIRCWATRTISSFHLRIVSHEILKLLVVMILRVVGYVDRLKLFHIRIYFLFSTTNILWHKSIVR